MKVSYTENAPTTTHPRHVVETEAFTSTTKRGFVEVKVSYTENALVPTTTLPRHVVETEAFTSTTKRGFVEVKVSYTENALVYLQPDTSKTLLM